MDNNSKPLGIDDESAFSFVKEILDGDPTYAINFDRLQKHPRWGYIIFEFLLCDEKQAVNPYTSHPNRYWWRNSRKFISLFRAAQDFNAKLYLVNYAKAGTLHQDKVRLIEVINIDEQQGITQERAKNFTRQEFSEWFRNLNKQCSLL